MRFRWLAVVFLALSPLLLSACIEGKAPFFVSGKTATPLPAEFVLLAREGGKQRAWHLRLDGDAYAWINEKTATRTALVPLAGAPNGYFVAVSWEGDRAKSLYGLARISPNEARLALFDAGKAAAALGVPVEATVVASRFGKESDLVAVFADVARRLPMEPAEKLTFGDLEIAIKRFEIVDLGDPATRARGQALLRDFQKDPED
jgi:hypothetical protein